MIKSEKSIFGGIGFMATHFNVECYHIDKCLKTEISPVCDRDAVAIPLKRNWQTFKNYTIINRENAKFKLNR